MFAQKIMLQEERNTHNTVYLARLIASHFILVYISVTKIRIGLLEQ